MKVVFISNYFSHHQSSLCEELHKLTNGGFVFVETQMMENERINLGWGVLNKPKYVIKAFSGNNYINAKELINDADVVIVGDAPYSLAKYALKKEKLTYQYSERIFKKKYNRYKLPVWCVKFFWKFKRYKKFYLLAASAYASADYAKMFSFIKKSYKWGYFPELKRYENIDKLILHKNKNSLVWVARFIDWKHPETAIEIAKRLKSQGYKFNLKMIGCGEREEDIKKRVCEFDLNDCVEMHGSMSPEQVREHMEKSEIHIFTSDRNEGWGAVLNESMNSACAVVASHAIGSVPFLIKDGINGLIYNDANLDDLLEKVKYLLDNPEKRINLSNEAYKTIIDEWNAKNAAKRIMLLSERLLQNKNVIGFFDSGPCSPAEILKDNWYENCT